VLIAENAQDCVALHNTRSEDQLTEGRKVTITKACIIDLDELFKPKRNVL
jgi:hypothetical protein